MASAMDSASPEKLFEGTSMWRKVKKMETFAHSSPLNDKVAQRQVAAAEDAGASGDTGLSDGSRGVAAHFMDVDAESQKSHSCLTSDATQLTLKAQVMETLITSMFTTMSSLKGAYMQLQSAHVPYDADKIRVADKAVIAELKQLSELKHSYKERLAIISSESLQEDSEVSTTVESKAVILKSYEGIISNFHSEMQKKDAVIEHPKDMLAQTTLKKEKLERRVKRVEQRLARDPLANSPAPTPQLLEYVVLGASEASRNFTKLLTSFMKVAQGTSMLLRIRLSQEQPMPEGHTRNLRLNLMSTIGC